MCASAHFCALRLSCAYTVILVSGKKALACVFAACDFLNIKCMHIPAEDPIHLVNAGGPLDYLY